MSTPAQSRLPARPSLAQLRKQAKERLDTLRAADPDASLADAQLAIARDYGFASWPKLVHHIESVLSSARIDEFEQIANDVLAGYHGDVEALRRLIAHYGVGWGPEQFRERVQGRVDDSRSAAGITGGDVTLDEVRQFVAHEYGFDTWQSLAQALAQPPADGGAAPIGLSTTPPFYRIDPEQHSIEVRPPLSDRDWDTIAAVMRERGISRLKTSVMTDAAMAKLSRLDFVTVLELNGPGLSDDGLLQLAHMPQIESLELGGNLTDRGFEVLRELPRLRNFAIYWMSTVSDAGLANLTFCDELERVNLLGTYTGDGTLNALRGKRHLRKLTTGRLVTDAGIAFLHDLPVFKTWQGGEIKYDLMAFEAEPNHVMLDGPFTDAGLAKLAGLDGLFGLGFFWHAHAFTGAGLGGLTALPNLGFLACQDAKCDDAAMRHIAAIPKLRMLMGQGAVATDDGFVALSRSRTIEYIWGRDCPNLTGRGFAALAAMPALRGLGVSCKRVDDESLASLSQFPALKQLMPMDVNDAGFRHVGACTGLEDLWCMYCRDTGDEATRHLDRLALKTYYAGKTRITDVSCELLARMSSLESVELWETAGVTDAGIAALAKLPRLSKISVAGAPRVSRQGMTAFPPRVRVSYDA
jgi:hypothetical protein